MKNCRRCSVQCEAAALINQVSGLNLLIFSGIRVHSGNADLAPKMVSTRCSFLTVFCVDIV